MIICFPGWGFYPGTISLQPEQVQESICLPGAATFRLRVSSAFSGEVSLELLEPPPGLEASFLPGKAAPGGQVELQIRTLADTLSGVYPIMVRGSDGVDTALINLELRIKGEPRPFDLLGPVDHAGEVDRDQVLRWSSSPDAFQYHLIVARDAMLQDWIVDTYLQDTLYRERRFSFDQLYFWRVEARKECGATWSEPRRFRIAADPDPDINGTQVVVEPNPSPGLVRILWSRPLDRAWVEVLNMLGRLLQRAPLAEEELRYFLDLSRYPSGVYLIRIRERKTSTTRRVVIQH